MRFIRMDAAELALWREVGTRGNRFRRAMHDRAAELTRQRGETVELLDPNGAMVDNTLPVEGDPGGPPRATLDRSWGR